MKRTVKHVVIPFRLSRGRFSQGEMRLSSSEESAVRLAELMAERFAGVAAFEVYVDIESGEMTSPRLLARHGNLPDMTAMLEAA